jgi:putative addiction module CopG family antidote
MAMTLSADLEAEVRRHVASGRFQTTDEALRAAVSLLSEREETAETYQRLKAEIQVGVDCAERGEIVSGDEVFADLWERNRLAQLRSR